MKNIDGQQLTFPREWEFNITIASAARAAAEEGIAKVLLGRKVSVRPGLVSRTGAYASIFLTLTVASREELEKLSQELAKVPGVRFLL